MARKPKKPVILVFGEDDNDRESIVELVKALCPAAPPVKKRKSPLVLVRGRQQAETQKNAMSAAKIVTAAMRTEHVCLVIAHEDCDAVEPAHIDLSRDIESTWGKAVPCPVIAATPAFEIEAWWFLFPDAVAKVVTAWNPLPKTNRNVGKSINAKEALIRALRPSTKGKPPRDYTESDSPEIARHIRELGLARKPQGESGSFVKFANSVIQELCSPKSS